MKNILLIICMILILPAFAQVSTISGTLQWGNEISMQTSPSGKPYMQWPCKDCSYTEKFPGWPIKSIMVDLPSYGSLDARIISSKWEAFPVTQQIDEANNPAHLGLQTNVSIGARKAIGNISFPTIRKNGSNWEKLISYTIEYELFPEPMPMSRGGWTTNSVLGNGESYKIAIEKDGIYKLDYNYFKNTLGLDPANIDPRQIKIYGNGGGMLPQVNLADIVDDLQENAIYFKGESDGKFDPEDYLLIYAEGPNKTIINTDSKKLSIQTNLYSSKNYYFIQNTSGNGKRITKNISNVQPAYWSQTFQDVIRYEEDKYNLLDVFEYTQGSGTQWFGETFGPNSEKNYTDKFNFDNIVTTENAFLRAEFVARSPVTSKFTMNIQGNQVLTNNISSADYDNIDSQYAKNGSINYTFLPIQGSIPITAKYSAGSNAIGWIDYIEVMASRHLKMSGNAMTFQDFKTLNAVDEGYILDGVNSDFFIWNITNNVEISSETYQLDSNKAKFTRSSDGLERFIALNPTAEFPAPLFDKKIPAQNIHGIDNVDMVILYHSDFEEAVQKLKAHRSAYSNISIATVKIDELFNEFSSGRQDVSAIRNFARMLYERNEQFKYLLMFGDGTFDYKNNLNNDPHKNYVTLYETEESLKAIYAYPADDFFALLDVGEPIDILGGSLDIAIGRLTVNTPEEAEEAVAKIIHYDNPPETLKDWRNWLVFVADDDDGTFEVETDYQSKLIESRHPVFNHDKVYLDAFKRVSSPGGDRYPDATTAINNDVFKGCLIINYQGHGGPKGWAQERVLSNPDILSWQNPDKLTLLITATCSFTGYDDPSVETGGELAFSGNKGAIALFSTTRPVYNSANATMVRAVYDTIFTHDNVGKLIPMGEVLRIAKNWGSGTFQTENARKFTMIGDPSQTLAIPHFNVATYSINGNPVNGGNKDTLKALQKVTITGAVTDFNNNVLTDFNGKLYTTVFDKKKDYKTLGQGGVIVPFTLQKSVLFKGTASVTNGLFSITFYIPKDINYVMGEGKISYYAENGKIDAHGYYKDLIIGGSDNSNTGKDEPPVVKVYMNDENFKSGGITRNSPTLVARISDDLGINITGTSIGHDLTAILDENTENQIILNDFFESNLNDFTQGKVTYPLSKLSVGKHTISVKAWDISNNSGEGMTEFVIAEDGVTALEHVLSYPNPFISSTKFQFEHNLSNNNLHVRISIYSINGQLVKIIDQDVLSDGSRITGIEWDGRNDSGNEIARGVYIYNITLTAKQSNGSTEKAESSFEKLVLLK